MQLTFKGLEGLTIHVPNIFKETMSEEDYGKFIKDLLMALKSGFNDTDGSIIRGKPRMGTSNPWQIIAWLLLHPGEVHIRADTINVNRNSITVRWNLVSNESYEGSILKIARKLSIDSLMSFMITALLGDGSVLSRKKAAIKITISSRKFKKWVSLLDRLSELGFRWNLDPDPRGDIFYVKFNSGYAVDLAKAMINVAPELLKDILDAFNVKKWEDLKEVANLRVKFRKIGSQVVIAGVKFTVDVQKWTIRLRRQVNDYERVKEILDKLKNEYGDEFVNQISAYKYGNYYIITIPASLIEKHESIREQVIKVLQEKLKNTNNEKRKQIITKHLTRLTTYIENRTTTNTH